MCGELARAETTARIGCTDDDLVFRRRLRALVFPDEKGEDVPTDPKAILRGIPLEKGGIHYGGMMFDACRTCWLAVAHNNQLPKRAFAAGLNIGSVPTVLPLHLRDPDQVPLLKLFNVTSWDLPEPTLPEQAVISRARMKFSVLRLERKIAGEGSAQRYSKGHCMVFPVVIPRISFYFI